MRLLLGPHVSGRNVAASLRARRGAGRSHAGVILVYAVDHSEFAVLVRGIERWLERVPRQEDWVDLAVMLDRAFAS